MRTKRIYVSYDFIEKIPAYHRPKRGIEQALIVISVLNCNSEVFKGCHL